MTDDERQRLAEDFRKRLQQLDASGTTLVRHWDRALTDEELQEVTDHFCDLYDISHPTDGATP